MQKVVKRDGKNVKLDTQNDERLYAGHRNDDGSGHQSSRWIDMHAHRLKSAGKKADGIDPKPEDYVFYLTHYSQWQGESSYIQELTQEEAAEFAAEHYDEIECHLGLLDESNFE